MPTFIYKVDGKKVPSVSTVVRLLGENKGALVHSAWMLGMEGKNYRDEWGSAAHAGTAAHAMADAYMTKTAEEWPALVEEIASKLTPEERAGALDRFESLKLWLAQNTYVPVANEVSMVSQTQHYGGTLDCIGLLNGKPALIDIKSKTLYKDQIIQTAAYRALWNENHPDMLIESVHILGLSAGFHHHLIPNATVDQGWGAFQHLKNLHSCLKEIKT